MKKILTLLLLCLLVLSLTACDRTPAPVETVAPSPTEDPAAILAASDTDTALAAQNHTPPASSTDLQIDMTGFNTALGYVGRPVQELYAVIGTPVTEPTYGPSCIMDGAEDGMLVYRGFYIWTVRTQSEEVIHQVSLDE